MDTQSPRHARAAQLSDEFTTFYKTQQPKLVVHLASEGVPYSKIEEITQMAMIKIFEKWETVTTSRPAYLRTIAMRLWIDDRRAFKKDRERGIESLDELDVSDLPDASVSMEAASIERDYFLNIMNMLPRRQAQVLALMYADYNVAEIAAELQMPTSTVRSNVRHIRRRLDGLSPKRKEEDTCLTTTLPCSSSATTTSSSPR